jgi:hypothetical protein
MVDYLDEVLDFICDRRDVLERLLDGPQTFRGDDCPRAREVARSLTGSRHERMQLAKRQDLVNNV